MRKKVFLLIIKEYREKYEQMAKYLNEDLEKVSEEINRYKETINNFESANKSLINESNFLILNFR